MLQSSGPGHRDWRPVFPNFVDRIAIERHERYAHRVRRAPDRLRDARTVPLVEHHLPTDRLLTTLLQAKARMVFVVDEFATLVRDLRDVGPTSLLLLLRGVLDLQLAVRNELGRDQLDLLVGEFNRAVGALLSCASSTSRITRAMVLSLSERTV